MVYKTIYKLIQGDKKTFEENLNKASQEGFIWCGNMNTNLLETGFWFTQLMTKTIPEN